MRRVLIVLATGAAITVATAGCGSSKTASGGGPATTTTTAASATASAATVTATATETATTKTVAPPIVTQSPTRAPTKASAAPGVCAVPNLTAKIGPVSGGLSHDGLVLIYTNTGKQPCTIGAYPGVAILNAAGKQIIQATRTPGGYLGGLPNAKPPFPVISLKTGGSASALLEGTSSTDDGGACSPESGVLTTPPSTTVPIKLMRRIDFCGNVQIHPVVAGIRGGANG